MSYIVERNSIAEKKDKKEVPLVNIVNIIPVDAFVTIVLVDAVGSFAIHNAARVYQWIDFCLFRSLHACELHATCSSLQVSCMHVD